MHCAMHFGPPPLVWLSRSLRGSCRKENTPAEQVEAGATVHLPLDQLEPGDLPLPLAAAPGPHERRPDRGAVLLQPSRKGLKSADPRRSGVGQPGVQRHARRLRVDLRVDPTPAHEGRQPAGQPGNARSGTVNLIGSGRDKAGEAGHTNAYARAATPVTAAQVWKAWVRAARYWAAGR